MTDARSMPALPRVIVLAPRGERRPWVHWDGKWRRPRSVILTMANTPDAVHVGQVGSLLPSARGYTFSVKWSRERLLLPRKLTTDTLARMTTRRGNTMWTAEVRVIP